jgi:hypothetical protein
MLPRLSFGVGWGGVGWGDGARERGQRSSVALDDI